MHKGKGKMAYLANKLAGRVVAILDNMAKIESFVMKPGLVQLSEKLIAAVNEGNEVLTARYAEEALPWARNTLASYVKRSIVDTVVDGKRVTEAPFNFKLRKCATYPEDLYEKLRAKHKELVDAVKEDTNLNFDRRVAAYNALKDAFAKAEIEAKRRERVAQVLTKAGMRPGKVISTGNLVRAQEQHNRSLQSQRSASQAQA